MTLVTDELAAAAVVGGAMDVTLVTGELVTAEAVLVSGEETWAAVAGDTLPSGGAVVRELGAPGRAGDTLSSAGRRSTNL